LSHLRRPQVMYWLPHISVTLMHDALNIHSRYHAPLTINAWVHSLHLIISQAYFNRRRTARVFLHTKISSESKYFCVDTQTWTLYL
jgi:hypothetical protein